MKIPARPAPPIQEQIFRLIYRLSGRRKRIDLLLTPLLRHRRFLPEIAAEDVIPHFSESLVSIRDFPRGPWATPLSDTLTVVKAAIGYDSKRILEIGSYRGTTAKLLAENTSPQTHIFALDIDPRHGESYRDTPAEQKITKLVGRCEKSILEPYAPFDLIFVDADHDYRSVCETSIIALEALAPHGVVLWHDYQNIDCFVHPDGCVPEALHALSLSLGKTICAIQGTMLAIYSNFPAWETARFAGKKQIKQQTTDAWQDTSVKPG